MYTVIFTDDTKFIFTKEQIMLIPYFNILITSSSFLEKDIINISSSSIGFKYIHMYATMDEIDIIDPSDKYLFVIKQCDYFGYDKLKILLEKKYEYKIDITDVKEKVGLEMTIKMKYLGKVHVFKRIKPIQKYGNMCGVYYEDCLCGTIHYNNNPITTCISMMNKLGCLSVREQHGYNYVSYSSNNNNIYLINPIYEYPDYSTDEEINEVYKKRYRMKYNTYFVKMIQNIISFGKDEIICVKIKDSYKLLSETTEDEYKNVECIIVNNEPKFNEKYFIKHDDSNLEFFEII